MVATAEAIHADRFAYYKSNRRKEAASSKGEAEQPTPHRAIPLSGSWVICRTQRYSS